jgi:hypothetical protein
MSYKKRAKPKLTATFTNSAGSAIDPTAVVIEIHNPDGTYDGYSYGLSSQGSWNASTNVPSLADGTGTAGHYYTVSTGGTTDFGNGPITFTTDDIVYYNGQVWQCLHNYSATAITKNGTGDYEVYHYLDDGGDYHYRGEGVGTYQCSAEDIIEVDQPLL